MNTKITHTHSQKANNTRIKQMPDLIPGMIQFGELNWIFGSDYSGSEPITAAIARTVTTGGYFERHLPAFQGDVAVLHDYVLDDKIPYALKANGVNMKNVWLPKVAKEARIGAMCVRKALDSLTNPKLLMISRLDLFTRSTDGCVEEFYEELDKILKICNQRGCYVLISCDVNCLPKHEYQALASGQISNRLKNYSLTAPMNTRCGLMVLYRDIFYLDEKMPEQFHFVLLNNKYGARRFHLERGAKPIWE